MQLMTDELKARLPRLGATDDQDDPVAQLHLFHIPSGWDWYVVEYDPETGACFGLVKGHEAELGYFSLPELEAQAPGLMGLKVERDLYFDPAPLSALRRAA
jgi:hypothetical protein